MCQRTGTPRKPCSSKPCAWPNTTGPISPRAAASDPGYARTGRVQPLAHGAVDLARSREAQARDLWQGFATWRVLPVADAPGLAVDAPSGFVVHDTLTARLHPRRAGAALVAALSAQGVTVEQGDSPQGGTVIWATGYEGLADLSRDLARNMGGGVKGQSLLLAHAAPNLPQVFAEGLHIVPHADGTVAIGSTSEREFDAPDTTDAQCEALLARARAACPELAKAAVIARWAGVRPRAQSRAPLMGGMAGPRWAFRIQRRFQDRLCHGTGAGADHGRSGSGPARPRARRVRAGCLTGSGKAAPQAKHAISAEMAKLSRSTMNSLRERTLDTKHIVGSPPGGI